MHTVWFCFVLDLHWERKYQYYQKMWLKSTQILIAKTPVHIFGSVIWLESSWLGLELTRVTVSMSHKAVATIFFLHLSVAYACSVSTFGDRWHDNFGLACGRDNMGNMVGGAIALSLTPPIPVMETQFIHIQYNLVFRGHRRRLYYIDSGKWFLNFQTMRRYVQRSIAQNLASQAAHPPSSVKINIKINVLCLGSR